MILVRTYFSLNLVASFFQEEGLLKFSRFLITRPLTHTAQYYYVLIFILPMSKSSEENNQ